MHTHASFILTVLCFKFTGLDFAYVKNGYVYHTRYDVPDAITVGAIQQAGTVFLL